MINQTVLGIAVLIYTMGCLPQSDQTSRTKESRPTDLSHRQSLTQFILKGSLSQIIAGSRLVQQGYQDGSRVYSVVDFKIKGFAPAQSGIRLLIEFNVKVDAQKSQYIALGASAGANISFNGIAQASFLLRIQSRKLSFTFESLDWPNGIQAAPSVWTNAKIARRAIRKKAYSKVIRSLPAAKSEIRRTMYRRLSEGLAAELPKLQRYFDQATMVMHDMPTAVPHLQSSASFAFFQHRFIIESGAKVSPPPAPPTTIETGFNVHQSLFARLLGGNLRGKTINAQTISEEICRSFSNFYYTLCERNPSKKRYDMLFRFDEKTPVQFIFEQNSIVLELRLTIAGSSNDETFPYIQKKLIGDEKAVELAKNWDKIALSTPPLLIRLTYERGIRQFKRTKIHVEAQPLFQPLQRSLMIMPMLETAIKQQLEGIVAEQVIAPAVPSYAASSPKIRSLGGGFAITDPAHLSASGGWLNAYYSYCTKANTQVAMGITMGAITSQDGKPRIKVKFVTPGSPAAKAVAPEAAKVTVLSGGGSMHYAPITGLKSGDIIYFVDGDETLVANPQLFSAHLAGRSLIPNQETVTLTIGRQVETEDRDDPSKTKKLWIRTDYAVKLRPACKSAMR